MKTNIKLIVISFIIIFCAQQRASAVPALGQKMDLTIRGLLFDNSDVHPLPEGWRISSYVYTDYDIFVDFENVDGDLFSARMTVYQLASELPEIGRTSNFIIEKESAGTINEDIEKLIDAFAERVKDNDSNVLFLSTKMKSKESYFTGYFQKYILEGFIIFLISTYLLGMFWNGKLVIRELLPAGAAGKFLLLTIMILSACLRFYMSPDSVIHNNGHGIREIRAINYPESREQKEVMYDIPYNRIMGAFVKAVNGDFRTIFNSNRIIGALTVVTIFMSSMAISGNIAGSFIAAAGFGVTPALLWLSSSESPITMYLFLATSGIALLVLSVREENKMLAASATAALMLAASMRLLTLLIIPAAVIILLATSRKNTKQFLIKNSYGMILGFITIVWCVMHYTALGSENLAFGATRFSAPVFVSNMNEYNLFRFRGLISPLVLFMTVAGVVSSLLKNLKIGAAIVFVMVLIVPVSFTCMADTSDLIRYQSATLWILFIVMSFIPNFITKNLKGQTLIAVAIAFSIILTSCNGINTLRKGDEENDELFFIEKVLKTNDIKSIILPESENKHINIEFPDFINKVKVSRGDYSLDMSQENNIAYLGLDCYRFEEDNKEDIPAHGSFMRPECERIHNRITGIIDKRDLSVRGVRGEYRRYFPIHRKNPEIGFYIINSDL